MRPILRAKMALVSTEAQLRSVSPGPEQFMTMNLTSTGPCTVSNGLTSYGRTVRRMKTRENHTTADVEGAQTYVRTTTLTNKPDSYGISVRGSLHKNIVHGVDICLISLYIEAEPRLISCVQGPRDDWHCKLL